MSKMPQSQTLPPAVKLPIVGMLAWLIPGLGHVFAGERNRGIVILVTVAVTFWGGIAIGGVRNTVDPQHQKLWFMAQICAGSHTLAAYAWGESERSGLDAAQLAHSKWNSSEVALVYTGVAGLLNLLAIMSALVRSDPAYRPPIESTPAGSSAGAT